MLRKIGVLFVFTAVLGLMAAPAFVQAAGSSDEIEMKATVTTLKGDVMITPAGSTAAHPAKAGEVLGTGDKIETGAGSIEITMTNNNVIILGAESKLVLTSLKLNYKTNEYENLMACDYGEVRAKVEKLRGKSKFQVKTPTAICGVRGTTFYMVVSPTGETRVFVADGTVDMTNPATGNTFVVVAGEAALSSVDGTLTELTGEEKDAIIAEYEAVAGGEIPGEIVVPEAPNQIDDPQSITENMPTQEGGATPTSPSPSD
ncbi:MAG: FecR domain-containing protein [Candidatus Omnitrophica bacterium]|nr:FecR domain-containing protein [Candidatus Omnitrophota bacterium]